MKNIEKESYYLTCDNMCKIAVETVKPFWPAVLARFKSCVSVERLILKKQRELEPEEYIRFMEAVAIRLEELLQDED